MPIPDVKALVLGGPYDGQWIDVPSLPGFEVKKAKTTPIDLYVADSQPETIQAHCYIVHNVIFREPDGDGHIFWFAIDEARKNEGTLGILNMLVEGYRKAKDNGEAA